MTSKYSKKFRILLSTVYVLVCDRYNAYDFHAETKGMK